MRMPIWSLVLTVFSHMFQHALESVDTEDGKNRVEDNDYIRTVVITRADNAFFMQMPVCLICGSIGNDIEGTMVSCATCAQSYHTFCVGLHDKVRTVIILENCRSFIGEGEEIPSDAYRLFI